MNIQDEKGQRKLIVRFISEGRYGDDLQKLSSKGLTVFSAIKSTGKIRAKAVSDAKEAVEMALTP